MICNVLIPHLINHTVSMVAVLSNLPLMSQTSAASASSSSASSSTTAPKKTRRGKVSCGVCQGAIVDGKDEALLCEGICGLWIHRGCASVPPYLYKELSNSAEPFVCLSCTNVQLKREILVLKNELKGMSAIRDTCTALATEVSSLRKELDSLKDSKSESAAGSSRPPPTYHSRRRTVPKTYAQATSLGAKTGAKKPPWMKNAQDAERNTGKTNDGINNASSERVVVSGVRRVCGVFQYCPAGAVISAIKKLARQDFGEKLTVHRRFREGRSGRRDKWWFLLKGEEAVLAELESMWDKVALQTKWKIQSCTMPQISSHPSPAENAGSQNASHEARGSSQSDNPQLTISDESLTTANTANVTVDISEHVSVDSQPPSTGPQ